MSKDGIFGALKSALAQVKSRVAVLKGERQALQHKRDALEKRLRECINLPLSKVAMVELCSRMVDKAAAGYRANFAALAFLSCLCGRELDQRIPVALVAFLSCLCGRERKA